MKRMIGWLSMGLLAAALALFAQNGNPQPGQGDAPRAYCQCDKNGDGLCDYSGLPVGQCRQGDCPGCDGSCPRGNGQGQGRGERRGPGPRDGSCPRMGASAGRSAPAAR